MRRRPAFAITLAAALSLGAIATPVAPTDAQAARADSLSAEDVAARVQAFYDQTETLQASFHQTYYHSVYQRYRRSRGQVTFSKPGRLRFDYRTPAGKVIASDGETFTAFTPGEDGEPGQAISGTVNDDALSGAFGFLLGTASLTEDYDVRLLSARSWRFRGHVLELRPRRHDPNVRRVILYVDSRDGREGVVHRLRIDDHAGNRNKFEMRRMRFNRDVPASRFAFEPPAGTELINR